MFFVPAIGLHEEQGLGVEELFLDTEFNLFAERLPGHIFLLLLRKCHSHRAFWSSEYSDESILEFIRRGWELFHGVVDAAITEHNRSPCHPILEEFLAPCFSVLLCNLVGALARQIHFRRHNTAEGQQELMTNSCATEERWVSPEPEP